MNKRAGSKPEGVKRNRNGILAGDELPITEWEDPTARVELPPGLMLSLDINTPVVRYARGKRDAGRSKHHHASKYIENPNEWVRRYFKAGSDRRDPGRKIIMIEDGDWLVKVALSQTKSTSGWSIATVFATNKPREKERWMKMIEEE